MWKAIWEYLTYERYGRRALRPGARIALGAAVVALAVILLGTAWSWRTARTGARPAPTLPPPTATAVFAAVTATARAPTPTPAPACPEDPRAWALVPLQAGLRDPKTGKPIQLPKPPQRIDPPCVYEGLARDLARSLVPNPDFPAPAVRGKTLSVPWFWAPGMEAPTIRVIVESADYFEARYDTGGKRIETRYVPYTAVATGDPDYPVLTYVYQDDPGVAWVMGRPGNREEPFQWLRIRLEGGEVQRVVLPVVYEAKTRRWIWIGYLSRLPPRSGHAVPAGSAEDVAALFGLPLWRRGELLARFGLKDIFPESVNPAEAKPIGTLIVRPDGVEARR
jgi:hypothetical protein